MKRSEALLLLRSIHQRAQNLRPGGIRVSDLEFTALEVAILSLEAQEGDE